MGAGSHPERVWISISTGWGTGQELSSDQFGCAEGFLMLPLCLWAIALLHGMSEILPLVYRGVHMFVA